MAVPWDCHQSSLLDTIFNFDTNMSHTAHFFGSYMDVWQYQPTFLTAGPTIVLLGSQHNESMCSPPSVCISCHIVQNKSDPKTTIYISLSEEKSRSLSQALQRKSVSMYYIEGKYMEVPCLPFCPRLTVKSYIAQLVFPDCLSTEMNKGS